ncbi:MAG: primosomal protein N' [Bacteroidales bacterium]|nr:primosomal protein N' [Bacteroidales bacterium]
MADSTYIQVILPLRLEWEPCYRVPEGTTVRIGDRVRVLFARKEYVGAVSAVGVQPQTDENRILPILAAEEGLPKVLPEEIKFWRAVSDYYLCSIGEVYKAAYPALKIDQEEVEARVKERLEARLERLKGKADKARRDDTRERYKAEIEAVEALLRGEKPAAVPTPVTLSPAQETAAASARKAFEDGKTVLLHGVTGSGKTEIYLKLTQEALENGRNVLFLVPEIALSRQLEDRIAAVFPDVQVFHSGVSAARRAQVASRIRKSGPYLVLGTRSALFLPHHDLGLIIVDEEHDTSYKQDAPAPRYNARESAIMLGVIQQANVVLGSATPSLESLYNAETGRFVKVDLKERFHAGEDAEIRLIDTVAERRKRGMTGSFSRKLIHEINDALADGGQVLVLRARRSYAPSVQCTECGKIPKCPHCHVPMSLHRGPDRLVCHYCGHTEPYTGICPSCQGELQPLGAGTQKVEEELRALYPERRIARLDGDTPDTEEAAIIRGFADGDIDILVGTQIITKGFDFDGLSLVAVLQADSLVGQQDFRADERAFQLLEQFRGRSGRRGKPGRIVIQTREPEHPVYTRLQGSDDADLLAERRLFGYPPYTRLVHVTLKDSNEKRLEFLSKELRNALLAAFSEADTPPAVVGPYAPALDRIAGESIRQIRVTFARNRALTSLKKTLEKTLLSFGKERKYTAHLAVDVDPV